MLPKKPNLNDFLEYQFKNAPEDLLTESQITLANSIIGSRNLHAQMPSGSGKTYVINKIEKYLEHAGFNADYGKER